MSEKIEYAFPVDTNNQFSHQNGMTLRDWFAGQALAGLLSSCGAIIDVASTAYRYADAMLEARKQ